MEPEITTPVSSKKKFFIIAVVVLVALGIAGYLFMQKDTPEPAPEEKASLPVKTQAQIEQEKRIAEMVQAIPKDTMTQAEKSQLVKSIPKKTTLTAEEQARLLQAIPPSTTQ